VTPSDDPRNATASVADLNAALAGRYVIDSELGHGGMATVYLTRDLKHERFVALKTLRPEIAHALGRERFLREIKLAARLQHPSILPVYDSGDANGTLFYTMPYVEGESLRDRLNRETQLSLEDAFRITRAVADALAYAHGHDVIHRDIKPENIMLSGEHALVADFGIARAVNAAGGDKLTETGLSIGTPAYMSPEQAAGDHVDRRSDIYSLACVLYEMLAGQPPFTGPTAQAIMARHSLDSVPRLKIVRETIPDALDEVIKRALAKVPADRYDNASQFAAALTVASTGLVSRLSVPVVTRRRRASWYVPAAVAAGLAAVITGGWLLLGPSRRPGGSRLGGLDPRRLAVLYFADFSRDSSLGHVADGFTEGLIAELSPVRGLDVVSRNGVAPFHGSDVPRDSIGRLLRAGSVIDGSVEPAGAGVRVNVRLVDGASGADIDRASFDVPAAQLLTARDSVAREVARLLRGRVGDEIELRERRAATSSLDAWTLVQRGEKARKAAEAAVARGDAASVTAAARLADSLLGAAERADPDWSEPVVLRGQLALLAARTSRDPAGRAARAQEGLAHAERALQRDRGAAPALALRGSLRYQLWRSNQEPDAARRRALLDSAHADLEAALRIDPTLAGAHAALSQLYYTSSHREDVVSAVLEARAAYDADAYLREAETLLDRLFWGSYDLAQFGEARRWCDEGGRRFPANWRFAECQVWLLLVPGVTVDVAGGWRWAARADSLTPATLLPVRRRLRQIVMGGAIGAAGQRDSAEQVLLRARTSDPAIDPERDLPGYEAVARAHLGDRDGAMALLRAYVATHPDHSFQRGGMLHWWWRDLERHPGFRAVLRSAK
jgi:serine/threonine-protein kinase